MRAVTVGDRVWITTPSSMGTVMKVLEAADRDEQHDAVAIVRWDLDLADEVCKVRDLWVSRP